MRTTIKQKLVLLFSSLLFSLSIYAADEDSTIMYQIDLGSRFIWRGECYNSSPIMQATFGYAGNKLSVYGIGAYSLAPNQYCELDLFVDYSITSFLKIGIGDYFGFIDSALVPQDAFNMKSSSTAHIVDAYISYDHQGKIPFNIMWSTLIYGADKDQNNINNNAYSSYVEASVPFQKGDVTISPFLGSAPYKGFYSSKAAVVNMGLKFEKTFMQDASVSFPTSISFICNPHKQKFFFSMFIGIN